MDAKTEEPNLPHVRLPSIMVRSLQMDSPIGILKSNRCSHFVFNRACPSVGLLQPRIPLKNTPCSDERLMFEAVHFQVPGSHFWLLVGGWLLVVGGWWLVVVCCWLLVVGCWLLVAGCWLLAVGCWLLVVGGWLLVIGG